MGAAPGVAVPEVEPLEPPRPLLRADLAVLGSAVAATWVPLELGFFSESEQATRPRASIPAAPTHITFLTKSVIFQPFVIASRLFSGFFKEASRFPLLYFCCVRDGNPRELGSLLTGLYRFFRSGFKGAQLSIRSLRGGPI